MEGSEEIGTAAAVTGTVEAAETEVGTEMEERSLPAGPVAASSTWIWSVAHI
jgi:hypothetical protein